MSGPSLTPTLAEQLRGAFGERLLTLTENQGQTSIEVAVADWLDVAETLRDHADFRFSQLIDLCGVDYLGYGEAEWDTSEVSSQGFSRGVEGTAGPGRFDWARRPEATRFPQRFAVVVHLLSIEHNRRLRLRCFAPDHGLPVVPSLIGIWRGVNWFEREAFDLYGIVFEGHPDLRRILSDYGFVGYPFRKDFPLIGNVEVRYDEAKQRVVYEPVSIEPRVGVPRTVRHAAPSAAAAPADRQAGAGV
ncbi:MAG: NADH-quinone oxidoreductase subunit C [Lysobacterales bacterium]